MADLFVNEAFGILDKFNGGFLKGSRTANNISIFKTLIQRQLLNGENCLCTLSISRTLSTELIGIFYSISYSIRGSTDTSLKPYIHKTYFRLKVQGKLRPCVFDSLGVNQGGIASNVLFFVTWQILGSIWIRTLVSASKTLSSTYFGQTTSFDFRQHCNNN